MPETPPGICAIPKFDELKSGNPLKDHIYWLVNHRGWMHTTELLTYNFSMYNFELTGQPFVTILQLLDEDLLKIITFMLPDARTVGFIFPAGTQPMSLEDWKALVP